VVTRKSKWFIAAMASVLAIAAPVSSLYADAQVSFNKDNLSKGIIAVKYKSSDTKKAKVLVQYKDSSYQYNIKSSDSYVSFPLQLGNGSYTVGVYEQIEGTKYAGVASENVTLNMDDTSKVFLNSIQIINWTDKMNTVTLAKELTKNKKTDKEKVEVCYQYMVQQFQYDYAKLKNLQYDYIPVIDDVLKKKLGICYDYSAVLASMLRSQGIKCKLIMGYTPNVKEYHAWNEIELDGKWVTVDTTYDSQMYAAHVKYTFEKPKSDYTESYHY
jgi:transglutaminase-like putative cysteine protease